MSHRGIAVVLGSLFHPKDLGWVLPLVLLVEVEEGHGATKGEMDNSTPLHSQGLVGR